jgi:hypothetical protein
MIGPRPSNDTLWDGLNPEDVEFAVGDGEVSIFLEGRYFTHIPTDMYREIQQEDEPAGEFIIEAARTATENPGEIFDEPDGGTSD